MEYITINGIYCVIKQVDNIEIYKELSKVKGVNIAKIIKIENDLVYYKYINGQNLRYYINNDLINETFVKNIFKTLLEILKELSKHNIIHKDIKPENIIITDEKEVFLIDFDASRILKENSNDTRRLGTEKYASPEHYGYTQTTFKSDMYSLGIMIDEIDNLKKFSVITKKMCEIDPRNRFESFEEILIKLEKEENKQKNIFKPFKNPIFGIKEKGTKLRKGFDSFEEKLVKFEDKIVKPKNKVKSFEKNDFRYEEKEGKLKEDLESFEENIHKSKEKKDERMSSRLNIINKIEKITLGIFLILLLISMSSVKKPPILLLIYSLFIILDFVTYIFYIFKIKYRKGKNKEILKLKIKISFAAFIVTLILYGILDWISSLL